MVDSRATSETSGPSERGRDAVAIPRGERVTINLTDKAAQALQRLQEETGFNKTDCINRALIIYEEVERMSREPGVFYWRENTGTDLMMVKFV